MVNPIRPSFAANKPITAKESTNDARGVGGSGGSRDGIVGGSGSVSIKEQKRIIKAADENGTGAKGDGLANGAEIYAQYVREGLNRGGDQQEVRAQARSKADALMKNLDVKHDNAAGGDDLVNAGDVDNHNAEIEYYFSFNPDNGA